MGSSPAETWLSSPLPQTLQIFISQNLQENGYLAIRSALRAAALGFLFRVKCLLGWGWWPTTDMKAFLFKKWHSSGSTESFWSPCFFKVFLSSVSKSLYIFLLIHCIKMNQNKQGNIFTCSSLGWRPPCWAGLSRGTCPSDQPASTPRAPNPLVQPAHLVEDPILFIASATSKIASSWGRHCSRFLRPMWRKERRSFNFTWGWRSYFESWVKSTSRNFFFSKWDPTWKQFLIFFRMSGFNCDTIDPPVQESFEVPERGQK